MVVSEGERTFKCSSTYAIFRHIAQLTRFEKIFLGRTETDSQQILSYFELIGSLQTEELATQLNTDLNLRMFLATYNITAADIFAYAHIVHYVQGLQDFEKVEKNNLFRWVDHLQNLPGIDKYAKEHELEVSFPDENARQPSKSELKKLAKQKYLKEKKEGKKNEKKGGDKAQSQKQDPAKEEAKAEVAPDDAKDNEEKKTKKEKKKDKAPKQQKQAKNAPDTAEPITRVSFVVGQITKVWKHPESDKLYCEEVDIGEDKPRSIASGLQDYIPIEKMENAMVVVWANLKSRKLGGFASHGMVMCAETPDKSVVELLVPPEGSKPGDLVTIKGFERDPPAQLNPKKKIMETVMPDFKIDESGLAKFKDAEWVTERGNITSSTVKNGIIA
jgi:aminoacyl tRNA synthase complex-interacting multifunctional protein 1